jgi:sporulation protein YlmC with PRC-barrel domain
MASALPLRDNRAWRRERRSTLPLRRSPHGGFTMSNPVISSKRVEGTAVYNPDGDKLGSIDEIVIDKRSGQVRYASLEFGGFLGLGTDRYPVPWNLLTYDTDKDGYVVPLDAKQLDKAPRYAVDKSPVHNEDYGRSVYDYYGLGW